MADFCNSSSHSRDFSSIRLFTANEKVSFTLACSPLYRMPRSYHHLVFFFRNPLIGDTGYRASEFRKGGETFHMSTDDIITMDAVDRRVKKIKHISPEDWPTVRKYLFSSNSAQKSIALMWSGMVNQPEYHDVMIAAARQAMRDGQSAKEPSTADNYEAEALHVLWVKNAPGWQNEYRRLQALPHKGTMTKDFLEEIQSHQR